MMLGFVGLAGVGKSSVELVKLSVCKGRVSRARSYNAAVSYKSRLLTSVSVTTPRMAADLSDSKNGQYDYDLFVIGAGSGGVRASRIAAGYGAKVAVTEERYLGGTCVNVGCVPKKLFVYGSHYGHVVEESRNFGWDVETPKLNWNRLIENKNKEIERLNGVYRNIMQNANVEIINGRGELVDEHTVKVGSKQYTADKILIAVGSWPNMPKVQGIEHAISSNEFFFLPELPKRTLIVGGGYIAVEFAGLLNGFGSKVTLVQRGENILRGFDNDVRSFISSQMTAQGINFQFGVTLSKIDKVQTDKEEHYQVELTDGSSVDVDCVICATGRVPKTAGLGLDKAGVKVGSKGEIMVNEFSQTNVPNVFAVGDVTNRMNLTPVALAEGHCFADTEFGGKQRSLDYENIPTAVFAQPAIGTCGLTQEEAEEKYGKENIVIYKSDFRPLKQTIAMGTERTFLKLIVEKSSDRVVGCHIVEPSAGEIIQLVGVAMKAGATKADFDSTIGVHPTAAEELVTMRTPST